MGDKIDGMPLTWSFWITAFYFISIVKNQRHYLTIYGVSYDCNTRDQPQANRFLRSGAKGDVYSCRSTGRQPSSDYGVSIPIRAFCNGWISFEFGLNHRSRRWQGANTLTRSILGTSPTIALVLDFCYTFVQRLGPRVTKPIGDAAGWQSDGTLPVPYESHQFITWAPGRASIAERGQFTPRPRT